MSETKTCRGCKKILPLTAFGSDKGKSGINGYQRKCKSCVNRYNREWTYKKGTRHPMSKTKDCASFLGDISERALSRFFDHIKRMPCCNPGYDFLCGKGFKIDVKSGCLHRVHVSEPNTRWEFSIRKNKIADYFLCLAFDNRDSLKPQHVWLIPSNAVNHLKELYIPSSEYGINKWKIYEQPINKVVCTTNAHFELSNEAEL